MGKNSVLTEGTILIVDDTPENLTVLRSMLTGKDYRVLAAISGEMALKAVRTIFAASQ